ncbi:MAG: M28 family metallopeptidase [Nocardioidaceae bacterium]
MRRLALCSLLLAAATVACTGDGPAVEDPTSTSGASASPDSSPATSPQTTPSARPSVSPSGRPVRFDSAAALADVRLLAGEIGPRLTTEPAYIEAAEVVERRFREYGYQVRRQPFAVPAGDSWGVPVEAGRSFNVVATPAGFDPARPHVVVGAHLDTVAVAPGAEDNASGVAVLLELARLASEDRTRVPAVLIAFGGEEPRGDGDDLHHFGSQHYVRTMPPAQRDALHAMMSLDRVGVGSFVPVCTGPLSPHWVRDSVLAAAERQDIPARMCELTTSDHWSFEKAGFAVTRLGSIDYPEYHSADDLPGVVDRWQLARTGRVAWSWLSAR